MVQNCCCKPLKDGTDVGVTLPWASVAVGAKIVAVRLKKMTVFFAKPEIEALVASLRLSDKKDVFSIIGENLF